MDLRNFDSAVNRNLSPYLKQHNVVKGVIHLFLMLYAARIAPQMPPVVIKLFENMYFKLLVFSLILWTAQFSPSTAILISIAFLVTTNYATTGKVWEFLENTTDNPVASPEIVKDAVDALAQAATSETPAKTEDVVQVAQVAADAMKTDQGVEAVKTLAQAAVQSSAMSPEVVAQVVQTANESLDQLGCMPRRTVDMSKIIGFGDVDIYSNFP